MNLVQRPRNGIGKHPGRDLDRDRKRDYMYATTTAKTRLRVIATKYL